MLDPTAASLRPALWMRIRDRMLSGNKDQTAGWGASEKLPGRVIGVLRSFEPDENTRWQGGPSSGNHADFDKVDSQRAYSSDTPFGQRCLRLNVDDPVPFSGWRKLGWDKIDKVYLVGLLKIPHFPPEADVVRLRCKVLKGSFKLSVGGPVIQSGTSDVFSDPVELNAENCAEWRTIDLSLHERLVRNFRRARYSKDSPVIYQTRWGQEDFCLVGMKKSEGVILIDQIELVAMGEGRPFPVFAPQEIRTIRTIANFEDERDLQKASSLHHGYDSGQGQEDTFLQSWKRDPGTPNGARWSDARSRTLVHEPVRLGVAPGGMSGKKSLVASAHFAEEHSFALIKTTGEPNANALKLLLKAHGRNSDLQPGTPNFWGMAIDFLVLVAPAGRPFSWEALAASEELRRNPGPGFGYQISLKRTAGMSYGYYHARRLVFDNTWSTLVIPFADFVCGYGQGEFADAFKRQHSLQGSNIVGIMYTGPIRFDMEIAIDEISYVHVPGDPATLRSYRQVPDVAAITLAKSTWLNAGSVQALPGHQP